MVVIRGMSICEMPSDCARTLLSVCVNRCRGLPQRRSGVPHRDTAIPRMTRITPAAKAT